MDKNTMPPPPTSTWEAVTAYQPGDRVEAPYPHPPKPKLLRFAALAAIIGIVLGYGAGYRTAPVVEAIPAAVTTTIETTPQACLDALDMADDAFTVSSRAITAIIDGRYAEADRLVESIDAQAYNRAKADCRAAA